MSCIDKSGYKSSLIIYVLDNIIAFIQTMYKTLSNIWYKYLLNIDMTPIHNKNWNIGV